MNRFDLSFSGQILPGEQPASVKRRFGKEFDITDPERLERFFSGETIILRRNLDRKTAAQVFQDMRRIGVVAELVKVSTSGAVDALVGTATERETPTGPKDTGATADGQGPGGDRRPGRPKRGRRKRKKRRAARAAKAGKDQAPARPKPAGAGKAEVRAAQEEVRQRAAGDAHREAQERAEQQAEEAARHEAEERARQQADEAARHEAEERARQQADEAQRRRQMVAEQAARQRILEEAQQRHQTQSARPRGADAIAQRGPASGKRTPTSKRVRTRLELPRGGSGGSAGAAPRRKRQAGEPNLYALRAFRNTPAVRDRAERAAKRRRSALASTALGVVGTLALSIAFLRAPTATPLQGAAAVTGDAAGGLILLAGDTLLLHDRAGHGTAALPLAALGVRSLSAPLTVTERGFLIARGTLSTAAGAAAELLRCTLEPPACEPFSPALRGQQVGAFAINRIDGSVLLADAAAGRLLRVAQGGDILAGADITLPPRPVLRLHSGLLMMNSARGPAISVLRYDDAAFGAQLDEVLLLPPGTDPESLRVGDFLWHAQAWWVSLHDLTRDTAAVYRFDSEWNPLGQVELAGAQPPLQLAAWGEKILVNDGRRAALWRFNRAGAAEVPLRSGLLGDQVAASERAAFRRRFAWGGGFAALAALAILGAATGYLQHLRALVYRGARPLGAELLDEYVDVLSWVPLQPHRRTALHRRGLGYGLLALACCLLAIGSGANAWQLAALLVALAGPAAALGLMTRQSPGHIGVLEQQIALVDHGGTYHVGAGARVHFRGAFLLIDDVIVFTGNRLLPAFDPQQLRATVAPRVRGGVRIDRKTLLVKLLQSHHPLALGSLAIAGACAAALVLLSAQYLF